MEIERIFIGCRALHTSRTSRKWKNLTHHQFTYCQLSLG